MWFQTKNSLYCMQFKKKSYIIQWWPFQGKLPLNMWKVEASLFHAVAHSIRIKEPMWSMPKWQKLKAISCGCKKMCHLIICLFAKSKKMQIFYFYIWKRRKTTDFSFPGAPIFWHGKNSIWRWIQSFLLLISSENKTTILEPRRHLWSYRYQSIILELPVDFSWVIL